MKNESTPQEKHSQNPKLSIHEVALTEVCIEGADQDELVCVSAQAIEYEDVALPEITRSAWSRKGQEGEAE